MYEHDILTQKSYPYISSRLQLASGVGILLLMVLVLRH